MALLFALVGFAGFAAALWIWLARTLDPISAALMIGGGGFVVSALVLLVAGRPRRPQSLFSAAEAEQLLAEVKARQSTVALWTPLIGVALIGYLLGSKSKD